MDRSFDALNETTRQNAEALRRLTLWCSLLAFRLGDGIADAPAHGLPEGLVPYHLQDPSSN